jgi:hypothetical protein
MGRPSGGEAAIQARMSAAPGLDAEHSHALAGLLDAEGYFAITRGRRESYGCSAAINLRDDDAAVLVDFREKTGLGHLTTIPARASSQSQVKWTVRSKLECLRLVELLKGFPMYGRKRREAAIWAAAVRRWAANPNRQDQALGRHFGAARTRLMVERQYRPHLAAAPVPRPRSPSAAIAYFGGFFSGEGCLILDPDRRRAQVVIRLRWDDRPLLECFSRCFGIGRVVRVRQSPPGAAVAHWHVTARAGLLKAIQVLDEAPLLGRKRRQYDAWRPGALELVEAGLGQRPADVDLVKRSRADLSQASAYFAPSLQLPTENRRREARVAYLDTLRAWAATHDGELSCVAYSRARKSHRTWPKRETIASQFGSWKRALEAAGLAHRAVRATTGAKLP